jgi:flagellin-like hook-associated protein FlgL
MGSDVSLSKAVRANLLSLQNTASMMDKTQNRLATGNKVNSALDNPSNFFTAAALNSRAADMSNLLDSMASGIKVIEAANNGITALTKNLESMQSTLRQARQDKSFQTKSFDVSDTSVIKLGGGQFGDGVSAISLATATKAGKPAELTTASATAYLGPVSSAASATGAGARSVISGLDGFSQNDKFTVAGREVTVSGATPTAESIVADIKSALNAAGSNVAGKYTVNVGEEGSANEGKIIIETVDTSVAGTAAEVKFNAVSGGVVESVKASTTFNYSAVSSQITAGGKPIPTGADYQGFVQNLRDNADAGGYEVKTDDETQQITLIAKKHGANPPAVSGIPEAVEFAAGVPAETNFTLANNGTLLSHGQTLTVGTHTVELTAGMDNDAVQAAFDQNEDLKAQFNVTVTAFGVEIKEKTPTNGDAPVVTSSQVATAPTASKITGVGGTNFSAADPDMAALEDGVITLTAGTDTFSYIFTDDAAGQLAAIQAGALEKGFLVENTAAGLSFSRLDGKDFSLEVPNSTTATALGLGATTTINTTDGISGVTTAGAVATTDGITGRTAATVTNVPAAAVDLKTAATADDNLQALEGGSIYLSDANGNTATYSITDESKTTDLVKALNKDGFTVNVTDKGLTFSRADGANFSVTVSGGPTSAVDTAGKLGLAGPNVTTANGVDEAAFTGVVDGVADTAAVNGWKPTSATPGVYVDRVAAEKNEFTISYDGKTADISIGAVKGGIDSPVNALDIKNWQDATITSVNNQLKNQGIDGVEIKFDDAGKMQFVAKAAEAKTLAVSGDDAVALFGTKGVNTGEAEKSDLQSTKTVDKFVELINRDFAGQVRASNDNGKLRIENLSTQNLDINVDTEGALQSHKVDGNSVRANLHKQFNELRDQLDKLADDSSFNGINLLRGDKLKITFNESGTSSIDIQAKDANGNVRGINASNLGVDSLVAEDLDTDEKIDAFLAKLSSALTELRSQASSFGSNLSSVENRQSFTKNMINTLETGAANLTLADTNEEAANLLALQTRQQLSSSALSMASQQDQAVLQLLR